MFLLSNSPTVELLPLVECAFALGQKRFRLRAKSKKVVAIAVNSYVSIYYWMGVMSFEGKGSDR
jgi:hypothetical protein